MKQRIFMYLFVFAALVALFQYVNSKRVYEELDTKLNKFKESNITYQDSIAVIQDKLMNASHFKIEGNEDALSYFERDDHKVDELIPFIKDELYKTNEVMGEHPIVPYGSSEGRKILINTVKILNHKWIIADFSDGEYWGEIFLTYEVAKDGSVSFNLVESFLYPFD